MDLKSVLQSPKIHRSIIFAAICMESYPAEDAAITNINMSHGRSNIKKVVSIKYLVGIFKNRVLVLVLLGFIWKIDNHPS